MENVAKTLAWSALGVSILFMILALTAVFGGNAIGAETATLIGWFGAVPLVSLALLLAVAVLVTAAFSAES